MGFSVVVLTPGMVVVTVKAYVEGMALLAVVAPASVLVLVDVVGGLLVGLVVGDAVVVGLSVVGNFEVVGVSEVGALVLGASVVSASVV